MNRTLRYATANYQALLRDNSTHLFAQHHALRLYKANAIYSFIPKNACSTLRLSLAMANGCVQHKKDFNWIHQNNSTFIADLASLLTADYTFVVLRCPYARLASAFLDKLAGHTSEAWQLYDTLEREREVSSVSFEYFIKQLKKPKIKNSNIHWRPQIDFLVYQDYDDYFALENFPQAIKRLKEVINLSVVDARDLTHHGIDKLTLLGGLGDFTTLSAVEILQLKQAGQCPSPVSLYNEELIAIVNSCYKADIKLYKDLFGSKQLLFS